MFQSIANISDSVYHYSRNKYTSILSLEHQIYLGIRSSSLQNDMFEYSSFLFERIPLDIVRNAYPEDHFIYGRGDIFEHTVTISDIDDSIKYVIVESEELVHLRNKAKDVDDATYFKEKERLIKQYGLYGNSVMELAIHKKKYAPIQRKAFMALTKSRKFKDEYINYYAPTIPHAMIKVQDGKIKVSKVSRLTI